MAEPKPVEEQTVTQRLASFLQVCMEAAWEGNDMGGGELQDLAKDLKLLKVVPFDPENHNDEHCVEEIEPGSDWYMLADDVSALHAE